MEHSQGLLSGLEAELIIFLVVVVIFAMVLKSIALWKAARRTQTAWFVCLLIFNAAGILPIIYLLTAAKNPETLNKV